MKKIMILGASILQVPAIRKAKEMGYHVIAVDIDEEAIGFRNTHENLLISTIDTERIVEAAQEHEIDGIMTLATDMPVRGVATVVEKLGLIGISTDTAYCSTDKFLMRERLSKHQVPVPVYKRVKSMDDYYSLARQFNYPYIVKPADNSGSRGIFLVQCNQDVEKAFHHATTFTCSGDILVEEFMQGREVSVETISYNHKLHFCAITDKMTSGPPHFVETGHSQPAQFDLKTITRIEKVTADALIALGIDQGPAHTEMIITDEGPKIVEVGARLGGGFITTHLVPLSTGIDMIENSILVAMNETPDLKVKLNMASAVRFFTPSPGTISTIKGIDRALMVPGVQEVNFLKKEGDKIDDLESGSDRVGSVIASGERPADAIYACEAALDYIEVAVSTGE